MPAPWAFSDYTENKVLDHITGKATFAAPAAVAVALYTAAPTDAGGGTEVTNANAYARVTTVAANWTSAAAGSTSNAQVLTFPTPTGSWGTVVAFALLDSATYAAGNFLAWAALTTSQAIGTGNSVTFAIGALVITLD